MTMDIQRQANFHLAGGEADDSGALTLRPALFAGFQDLPSLRHDYPLVLIDGAAVRSLTAIIDEILQDIAPRGIEGEPLRREVLGLEDTIRAMVSRGAKGRLSELWALAEDELPPAAKDQDRECLAVARRALRCDGEVIDCDAETPSRLLIHLWSAVESDKANRILLKIESLAARLSDILKADYVKSAEARNPAHLERSVGPAFEATFDFEVMSQVLASASPGTSLPESRRRRIEDALSVLESQRFFAPAKGAERAGRDGIHGFSFDSCAGAMKAFEERLPELAALVKAMFIAELEIENQYHDATHDRFFEGFDESALAPDDLEPFPSYLVCLRNGYGNPAAKSGLVEAISSGLPLKVLLQKDDILEDEPIAGGKFAFGVKSLQLPAMALGLHDAYVVQAGASHLHALGDALAAGLRYSGPALFSIYSGAAAKASRSARNLPGLAPYLKAAAAVESRAFPAFTYNPAGGADWADRFRLMDNPQAEADWPVHRIAYEDEDLQRAAEDIAFTFVDFVASDKRYAGCFAPVPRCEWHEGMAPVSDFLALDADEAAKRVPYVLLVDERNRLHRAIVAVRLIDAARRCAAFWRGLRELGGIGKSPVPMAEAPAAEAPPAEPAAPAEEPGEAPPGAPGIETPRCTTCHECIEINNKMFSYDENMQAVIADLEAGSFRQLVEAAENCQVCIIHPGNPWNDAEPGLDELVKRAEAFN